MPLFRELPFFFLWFGAAVSLSEILAGTLLAPLGLVKGIIAILLGHVIGTTLLVLGGIIGTRQKQTAMGSTQAAFGRYGRALFALLNVIQLVGWTVIMLRTGADQLNHLSLKYWHLDATTTWIAVLGAGVCIWVAFGRAGIGKLNTFAVLLLIGLSAAVFWQLFSQPLPTGKAAGTMGFGDGLELVVVMPLSWLPLIADYNRRAESARASASGSWLGYMLGSSWMYVIGLVMALSLGDMDLSHFAGGSMIAVLALCLVIILSTVTTTFMDAYSAGVSLLNIVPGSHTRRAALVMSLLGLGIALVTTLDAYMNFLYTIGALFAPLYAVVLSRYFVLRLEADDAPALAWPAVLIWAIGVASYYGFLALGTPLGATLPAFVFTSVLYVLAYRLLPGLNAYATR
jgi:putative hydroxymethylpyrimidine transporter CytX